MESGNDAFLHHHAVQHVFGPLMYLARLMFTSNAGFTSFVPKISRISMYRYFKRYPKYIEILKPKSSMSKSDIGYRYPSTSIYFFRFSITAGRTFSTLIKHRVRPTHNLIARVLGPTHQDEVPEGRRGGRQRCYAYPSLGAP